MNHRVARCLTVWAAVTATALGVAGWSSAQVRLTGSFDELVAGVAGLALASCAVWAWLVTTLVVAQALRRSARPVRGVPTWVARAVLAACGLAALSAWPAHASTGPPDRAADGDHPPPTSLDGLPYPDRATGGGADEPKGLSGSGRTHVVSAGESLWTIAADQLPSDASPSRVAAATASLHAHNRSTVGPDPDVIHPGQQLRMPDPHPGSFPDPREESP